MRDHCGVDDKAFARWIRVGLGVSKADQRVECASLDEVPHAAPPDRAIGHCRASSASLRSAGWLQHSPPRCMHRNCICLLHLSYKRSSGLPNTIRLRSGTVCSDIVRTLALPVLRPSAQVVGALQQGPFC